MAKIPLRAYNREVEGLIDQGQTLEAVAHCQYILKTFPKCLDTYRLLGKAYLELQRFTEAADVFNRLLLAVPEDFIANLGMSIIYDDQKNLDAAIWHMERAFETQSSNPAIQGELRRLYSRRDGMEPPKIRLTRGALAQMYARGDQFPQAISEIKSVLAEEPQRMDLQVLLARVFFRAGQKVEATEISTTLLKKYPYCLDANRILLEILPSTSRSDATQVYRHRVNALDPYSAFASPSVFNVADVADAAVSIERLTYQADAWAPAKFGLEPAKEEAPPDWLTGQGAAPVQEPVIEPVSDENIPEWMKTAGWAATTAAAVEAVERASAGDETGLETSATAATPEEISSGEVPDWLKMMAPPGALEQPVAEQEVTSGDLNWLESLGAPASSAQAGFPEQPVESFPEGISTIGALGVGAAVGAVMSMDKEEQPAEEASAVPAEETPDWITQLGTPDAASAVPVQSGDELPDWLTGAASAGAAAAVVQPESDIPDWLKNADQGLSVGEPVVPVAETPATADVGLPVSDDDAFAWLESLAAKQGAKPEELLTKPEDRPSDTPDWLGKLSEEEKPASHGSGLGDTLVAAGAAVTAASLLGDDQSEEPVKPAAEADLYTELAQPAAQGEVTPAQAMSDDDAFSWLESLAARQGAKPEELLTKPEDRAESAPEWATAMGIGAAAAAISHDEPAQAETPAEVQGDLSWLQNIDSGTPIDETTIGEQPIEEIIFTQPPAESIFEDKPSTFEPDAMATAVGSASADEVAEWLQQLNVEDTAAPMEAEQKPAYATEELPDWLKEEEPAELPSADMPDWLKGESTEQPVTPPAVQAEWKPEQPPVEVSPVGVAVAAALHASATPAPKPAAQPKPAKSASSSAEKDKALFENSQLELQRGNLTESMQGYGKLIKKGKMLDETIFDLREALYRHPVDVVIWQTLGDAYMRAQRLQDALDAYTKAEELLR